MPAVRVNLGALRIRVEWDGRRNVNRTARVISYRSGYLVGFPGDWDVLDANKESVAQGVATKRKAQTIIRDLEGA